MKNYDLIIVGLGAMGSAALYQAARRKVRVLGLDRYSPPHIFGSSHAESRITRLAVGEGPQYIPLVRRSHEIWRELEEQTGRTLLFQGGGYVIGPRKGGAGFHGRDTDFVRETYELGRRFDIPVRYLEAAAVREQHEQLVVTEEEHAAFESTAGVVLCEKALAEQLGLAVELGARIHRREAVSRIIPGPDHVEIHTGQDRYLAERAIVTAGPWMHEFLPSGWQDQIKVYRQVVYWFEAEDLSVFSAEHFPFTIRIGRDENDFFASFPWIRNGVPGIKMLTEQYQQPSDGPEAVERRVSKTEVREFYQRFVGQNLRSILAGCVKAEVCLYTVTPNRHFLIDHHPETDRVLMASACSGHGFKHSPAIGECLVQLSIDGRSTIDLTAFRR